MLNQIKKLPKINPTLWHQLLNAHINCSQHTLAHQSHKNYCQAAYHQHESLEYTTNVDCSFTGQLYKNKLHTITCYGLLKELNTIQNKQILKDCLLFEICVKNGEMVADRNRELLIKFPLKTKMKFHVKVRNSNKIKLKIASTTNNSKQCKHVRYGTNCQTDHTLGYHVAKNLLIHPVEAVWQPKDKSELRIKLLEVLKSSLKPIKMAAPHRIKCAVIQFGEDKDKEPPDQDKERDEINEHKDEEDDDLPEEPTTCCMSGCANCVWIEYAEKLNELFQGESDKAKQIILNKVKDPNMKAFLQMELDAIEKNKNGDKDSGKS